MHYALGATFTFWLIRNQLEWWDYSAQLKRMNFPRFNTLRIAQLYDDLILIYFQRHC